MMWNVLMAAGGFVGVALLSGAAPLHLAEKVRGYCLLTAAAVNGAAAAAFWNLDAMTAAARVYLINLLLLTAVTDLKERQIYDLHFYALVLGGMVSAFLEEGTFARYALFLLLLGVLFLLSRKRPELGMGDSRMIACMALYFSLTGWMEIMVASLGCALLYGLGGIVLRKKNLKSELPFMPFLLLGVLIECFVER